MAGVVCLAALASAGSASPEALDRDFGDGGMVTTTFPGADGGSAATAVLVQRDGEIVLVGTSGSRVALARYAPDGSLDPSFGERGRVVTDLGGSDRAGAAALEPDGEIVVAGSSGGRLALARYEPDGSLDASFGDGGVLISGPRAAADWLATGVDGKILVAGGSRGAGGEGCRLSLARFGPAGNRDPSFGSGGEATTPFGCRDVAAVTAAGRRIIVAGTRVSSDAADGRLAIARYNPDGSPDSSFGKGGWAITRLAGGYVARAAAVQPDGRLLVAASDGDRLALARYTADGSPDSSFGDEGKVVTPRRRGYLAKAVLVRGGGAIITAGTARMTASEAPRFAVSGYRPDGSPDRSFGARGELISRHGRAAAAGLAGDGKVIVAGSAFRPQPGGGHRVFAALRVDARALPASGARPAGRTSDKRLRRQRGGHRPRAPHAVPAWYINADNFRELKRFVATDTCAFARTQPRAAHRTLILDFGGARAYQGGEFGAALNHEAFRATNEHIRDALKVASDAYAACHRRGQARIVYANTNHFKTSRSSHLARRIGVHQARTMRHVRAYQSRRGYRPAESAGVGGDIEMGFWGPDHSKDLVNGAKSEWHHGYVDFGTAGGCPPYPKGVHLTGCFNGWRVRDVAHASHAGGGAPLPEVYLAGGPHQFDQAAQWATVARSWNARHRSGYVFLGATGSTEFSNLTPRESWRRLRRKAPARVRRELLNFKQDRTLRSATAHRR